MNIVTATRCTYPEVMFRYHTDYKVIERAMFCIILPVFEACSTGKRIRYGCKGPEQQR